MIARTWRGATRAADAEAYLRYLHETGFREYRESPGNLGVLGLRRVDGERAEFLLVTLWETEEAIRRFAGDDMERAVFYPEDERFLVEADPTASHYEVAFEASGRRPGRPPGGETGHRMRRAIGRLTDRLLGSRDEPVAYDPAADPADDRHARGWRVAGFR